MTDSTDTPLVVDELFVGLTRPATIWGIPYTAAVIEVMAVAIVFLMIGNPLYLAIAIPIHAVLYAISANNATAFDSLFMWTKTAGRCRNSTFWNAVSFSPLRCRKWQR